MPDAPGDTHATSFAASADTLARGLPYGRHGSQDCLGLQDRQVKHGCRLPA